MLEYCGSRVGARHGSVSSPGLAALLLTAAALAVVDSAPAVFCRLAVPELVEASGLAPSLRRPSVYWSLNDSGPASDPWRSALYAFDKQGRRRAAWQVEGAPNIDWEDLAAAPPSAGRAGALFIADIGDTAAARRENRYTIYRVPEPEVGPPDRPSGGRIRPDARWSFSYPEGRQDAETLLVDPRSRALYVVAKPEHRRLERNGRGEFVARCGVYEIVPRGEADKAEARPRTTVVFTHPVALGAVPTGGSVALDGSRLVIRTYRDAYLFEIRPAEALWQALARAPRRIPLPAEPQGEGIAFKPGEHALLTISERVLGWNTVWEVPF